MLLWLWFVVVGSCFTDYVLAGLVEFRLLTTVWFFCWVCIGCVVFCCIVCGLCRYYFDLAVVVVLTFDVFVFG